ncbi:hypothetical protein ACFOSC_16585 [Streptantibioticus rubrisoli]|uniref:Uncharacterized protein n=1 Tax=Streptantibioticus rubrisoli TaxID=1387313 RepID=A0ABT1PD99_9ACTN|nr:hypothetical protein [Streptantibioticus rubrisoli]MCQ4042423.1 hypothetical protein [Streptantibioticus rubrisoli]
MPPQTEAALRAAVTRLSSANAAQFETELRQAVEAATRAGNNASVRTFPHRWSVFVAIKQHPERAARLREFERIVGESEDRAERRAAAAGIGALLAEAEEDLSQADGPA